METRLVAMWPGQTPAARAFRRSLAKADSALLCVAFANQKGVNLLQRRWDARTPHCPQGVIPSARLAIRNTRGDEMKERLAAPA